MKKKKKRRKKKMPLKPNKKKGASWRYSSLAAFFVFIVGAAFVIYKTILVEKNDFESVDYIVKGIDVSHHNTILNWGVLVEENISFVYIKATEDFEHLDRDYEMNYHLAKGINMRVGSYHFYKFGVSGAKQARHFINTAMVNSGDLIPAIDVEHSRANPYSRDTAFVSSLIKELKTLENELYEHYGVHPIIYTNQDCYNLYIDGRFKNNKIWMSNLENEPSQELNWRIWQYTHSGKLRGVKGHIDLNFYRYGFDEFKEMQMPY